MMASTRIAIVTLAGDIHAHVIRHELQSRSEVECLIIEVDRLSANHPISWHLSDVASDAYIAVGGIKFCLSEIDLIWWRRSRSTQALSSTYPEDQRNLIDNDCRSSFLGAFITMFDGRWVFAPVVDRACRK